LGVTRALPGFTLSHGLMGSIGCCCESG